MRANNRMIRFVTALLISIVILPLSGVPVFADGEIAENVGTTGGGYAATG